MEFWKKMDLLLRMSQVGIGLFLMLDSVISVHSYRALPQWISATIVVVEGIQALLRYPRPPVVPVNGLNPVGILDHGDDDVDENIFDQMINANLNALAVLEGAIVLDGGEMKKRAVRQDSRLEGVLPFKGNTSNASSYDPDSFVDISTLLPDLDVLDENQIISTIKSYIQAHGARDDYKEDKQSKGGDMGLHDAGGSDMGRDGGDEKQVELETAEQCKTLKATFEVTEKGEALGESKPEVTEKSEALGKSEFTEEGEALVESESTEKGEALVESEFTEKGEALVESKPEVTEKGEALVESEAIEKSEALVESEAIEKGEALVESEAIEKGEDLVESETTNGGKALESKSDERSEALEIKSEATEKDGAMQVKPEIYVLEEELGQGETKEKGQAETTNEEESLEQAEVKVEEGTG